MKATIEISGQIGSNHKLLGALNNGSYKRTMFNGFIIEFDTIGEAKKAIKEGWKYLKSTNDNLTWHDGISNDYKQLYYDASNAVIRTND